MIVYLEVFFYRINDVRFHSNFTLVFSWVIFGVLESP